MSATTPAAPGPPPRVAGGLDPVAPAVRDADHLAEILGDVLSRLGRDDAVVSTHLVPGEVGASSHVALSVRWTAAPPTSADLARILAALRPALAPQTGAASPDEIGLAAPGTRGGYPRLADSAARAAADAEAGRDGRAVVYPGRPRLTGTVTVADALAWSAIDEVVGLADVVVGPETLLVTREHVRPVWRTGRLVLVVQPAAEHGRALRDGDADALLRRPRLTAGGPAYGRGRPTRRVHGPTPGGIISLGNEARLMPSPPAGQGVFAVAGEEEVGEEDAAAGSR